MKGDTGPRPWEPHERAHLKDPRDASHVIFRYPPDAGFEELLRRFWIPVWSVPPGTAAPQKVLQYPVCLVVVSAHDARFHGVATGLSTTTLSGDGWAVGVMCAPAAGWLLTGTPVSGHTDRSVALTDVLGDDGARLADRVRAAMGPDPASPAAHRAAMDAVGEVLRRFLPVDPEGELVNRVVGFVEANSAVLRVAQVCAEFDLSERALQRLVQRRLGLTPKWLIQRRRLQEAAERLRAGGTTLAETAAVLGYADQPHFHRDFARVTGMTPGEFSALHAR
ncbi:helix-turn-helix domain-containing protein [Geodermatophilus ruber]|uniref:Transcriptional regulator, AraC family n=1 Tax=Geodermatophilus ruber TaxID=504800 RepID=A0A1I4FM66_9ACTN|nr:AraC family transcriptional regulator [Geodermatophilus ruber]SFL18400.1 transcriptional regulator, AraC family [Geodermatophilus ruber]